MIGIHAGGAAFTDFQRATARASTGEREPTEFRRRISARTTSSVGGTIGVWLSETLGVRAGVSYAPSSFTVWHEAAAPRSFQPTASGGEPTYAGLGVLLADATLLFRFPLDFGRVVPYGIVGGGLVRYWTSDGGELPPEARSRFTNGAWTGAAGVLGLGAAIPLQRRNLLLTFELTNHFSQTPLDDAGAGETFDLRGITLQLETEAARSGTDGVGLMNNLRMMMGITLPIR